jgi:HAD superfamily hydrolase (TIGR01509 family)
MDGIHTIFIDFGNVLAHFDHGRTVQRLAERERLPEEFLHDILYAFPRFDDLERGLIPTEDYINQIYDEAGLKSEKEFFRRVFGDIFTPIPAVCALIPKLATRYRLVLASNTNDLHAADFLPKFADTFRHFSKLVLSHEIQARKPDGDFYERCQEFAECGPSNCLFIDDRADNIQAGARHGWKTIQLTDIEALRRGLSRFGVYNDT